MRLSQADEIISEEENLQNTFGFIITDPDTITELESINVPKKACQGTPWYQILTNEKYKHLFNYTGAYVSEREKLIEIDPNEEAKLETDENGEYTDESKRIICEQSDFVIFMLNLASVPDSVIEKIDMSPGWSKKLRLANSGFKLDFESKYPEVDKWRF